MAYIIEARDGVVNVDAGAKVLTLSESLLPKLASGSSYVVVLYNVTTGETATFQEGPFIGSKELAINSSTLDPGTWKLGILVVLPSDLKNAQAYWDDARFPNLTPPEGISITKRLTSTEIAALGINPSDFSFNLINTKADSNPPSVQVSSIQLSDKVLNVDAGEKLLKLDFSVTDDKSKLDFINITFRNDAAQAEKELSYYPQAWNGWDRANFSILCDFSWAAPGIWYPVDIYVQDTSGNEISYNKDGFDDQYEASTLLSAGISINSIAFNVINKYADTTKPVVTFSSPQLADNIINVDQGENALVINGAVVDTGSGFQALSIAWRNVVTDASFFIWKDSVSIGSTGKFRIQQDTSWLSAGDWVVDYLSISDKAENTLEYSIDDFQSNTEKQKLLSAGIDIDKLAFKVINSNIINDNPDSNSPLLTISASETSDGILDAAIGEKALTLQGMVSDDKSGFRNLNIQFVNQTTITTRSFSISPSDLDDQGGFRKSIDFSWAANGTWFIQNLNLYDNAGNALNYYRSADPGSLSEKSKLLAAGIDVDKYTFEVRNSVQDITPPRVSLASPQLSDKVIDVNSGEKLATFTGKIQEQGSGFEDLSLSFQNQTDKTIRSLYVTGDSLQSDGSFTTTIDFSWASLGQWRLSSLWGSDKAGNRLQYHASNDSSSSSLTSEAAYKRNLLAAGLDIEALSFIVVNNTNGVPTYSLSASSVSINEGGTLTTSISTTGVTSGTTLYYGLSGTGITTADFSSGALTGQVTVGTNGTASLSHTLSNDLSTEGAETLQIKLFTDSARTVQVGSTGSVTIADTSITDDLILALPSVSVAVIANGNEADGSPVVFKFERTGDISAALSVGYQLFGTAQAGSDYSGSSAGTILVAAGSATATLSLPALADGALIDPGETIIARIDPSGSYSITPRQQFATATITAEGILVSPKARPGRLGEHRNRSAFAALMSDGTVVSWGEPSNGGTAPTGLSGVSQIFSNTYAFAALKSDGSVIAWGNTSYGGAAPAGLSGVTQIFSTNGAFAALKSDGSVIAWGNTSHGGTAPTGLSGVTQIFSTSLAFAALKADGSVVTWGSSSNGGTAPAGLSGVTKIFSTGSAFAALKANGSVVTWGSSSNGGTALAGLSGVTQIFSTSFAFAALNSDSSVVTWGDSRYGGTAPLGLSGVPQIFSNSYAFAALKNDGSVVSWGDTTRGGTAPYGLSGVTQIFSNGSAFAGLMSDGTVVAWGDSDSGGTAPTGLSGVTQIFSTNSAFAALKSDGTVVAWGDSDSGGTAPTGLSGVTQIFGTSGAFAALKGDGTVVTWGDTSYGGTAPTGLSGVVGFANPSTDDRLTIFTAVANQAPTDITLSLNGSGVQENSAAATVIGTLSATDPDAGSSFTYALVAGNGTNDADNALVEIVDNQVRVKSGAVIDFETNPILNLNIQVTDNGTPGLTFVKAVTASVLNVNKVPTGTPTLSGTFKAGQVVTIDSTPIQDADNFTGYTPTYNYSFEVSSNGTTWTKLTSTDATDNNSTYTLTTAEVGKKVRGVVSYLDGYWTNESVASVASSNVIAPSNTAPTAVQTLTGSSKVGRVLTADKSTIVDPDGVPTSVSYGWEVSSNGTTWTKLTSADANDNNSTYALTAAELGKTVRSVISYTDGFGANEVVRSSATTAVVAGSKPTNISLSSTNIVENIGPNASVATLRSVDLDTDDAYTYSFVTGSGSTDNSRFSIAGDQLVITGNPDFEIKNSYSIRLRTTDLGGLTVDKSFTLKVTNVNEAPIAINLSDSDFLENIAAGSVIGNLSSLDPDKETTFTYSLTPNSPRATFADNQFFSIVNDQLKINASANFEQKDSYTISVRSTDAGKLFYDQVFTLVVQDVDEAPTDISITGTGIDEGSAVGSVVGSFVTTDQDESASDFTYELVAGNKPNNNDQFEIVGDQLKAKATFNFETKSSYVVNVRTTDESGLTFTKAIIIRVNNVNENPTDLTVSATAFNENLAIGTTVSTLGVLDPDKGDTYSYSFVSGEGDKDNQAFLITGNALKVNVATNFEVQKSYAVRLRVTDQGGLFFDKAVSLGVNNQVEKVTSAVSTSLAPDKDTLELTGTKNIFGIGNQFDNTIVGNTGRNKLIGGLGKDTLTGGAGVDTFFYNDLKESLLSGFDVITDYAAADRITVGFAFEGDDLIASTGKASAFTEGAIGSVLTNTTFLANNAAAFTVEGLRGTFLALNDGRDGFQEESDALIHLSNYTIGSKTPISII